MSTAPKSKRTVVRSAKRATSKPPKPSKEKHVRILVMQTFQRDGSIEEIIRQLSKRLDKSSWAVVLKGLMIFHRCFREGDPAFIEAMKSPAPLIFALRRFSATAPPNHLFTVFVKKYSKYLDEKCSVLRLLGYQFEKNQEVVKTMKGQNMFKIMPKLQSQMNALLNCKMKGQHVGGQILLHHTYILLCQDSLILYAMLNDGVARMLDMFWKMNRKDASRTLSIYKLYVKETDALIGLYEIGRNFIRQLPEVAKANSAVIEQMEKYLDSIGGPVDEDDEGGKKKGKKGKKAKKEESSEEDDSAEEALNTRAGQEQYDEDEYDAKDDDDDEEESSGEGDDQPDYFKDFFAAMPSLAQNPVAQGHLARPQLPPQGQGINPYASQAGFASQPGAASPAQPFGAPAQPFGAPGTGGGIFGQPTFQPGQFGAQPVAPPAYQQKADSIKALLSQPTVAQPAANPFGAPAANPFAPAPQPAANPFAAPAQPAANPFATPAQPAANPFATPAPAPAANPFGAAASTPFGAAPAYGAGAFGAGGGQLVLAQQPSPFGQPAASPSPFGASAFGQPASAAANPFGSPAPAANPFGAPPPAANPFASGSFGQPAQPQPRPQQPINPFL